MSVRPLPAYMYRVPDPGDTRIAELQAALLETNDVAAALRAQLCDECERVLAAKVKASLRPVSSLTREERRP